MVRLIVIVATAGRGDLVPTMLGYLARQSRLPDEVILSAPDSGHIAPLDDLPFQITRVYGSIGSSIQRNEALAVALPRADIVTFFDDDYFPARTYLGDVERAFTDNSAWAVVMGSATYDGSNSEGISPEQAKALIHEIESSMPARAQQLEHAVGAYGCNMSVRVAFVGDHRFDERLALYGWQEDIDFTSRLRASGPIMELGCLRGVHLGFKKGRVSGVKFGYAQIINPTYLIRKGTMPANFAMHLIVRNLAANTARSLYPEPWIDRRGRLKGNLLGLYHIATGRLRPEQVADI